MELPVQYDSLRPAERRRVREEYVARQGGRCHHCRSPLSGPPAKSVACLRVTRRLFPDRFFEWPVHLHHDRKTGLTIGAVHNHCNAVLWQHHGE